MEAPTDRDPGGGGGGLTFLDRGQLLEELIDRELDLDRRLIPARLEVVVNKDRDHGDEDAAPGRPKRLRDALGHHREPPLPGTRDVPK